MPTLPVPVNHSLARARQGGAGNRRAGGLNCDPELSGPLAEARLFPPPSSGTRELAFTLIELLVVIAIIGLLASLLLPTLSRAKRQALSVACVSNLHQIGLALELYIQDNQHRLPKCPMMPSADTNLLPITAVLGPYLQVKAVFKCPADQKIFETERTSYEWNQFLNDASYDRPEDWSSNTWAIVELVFGGRLNTPLTGDAAAFHGANGIWTGKNALYFDGRVQKTKVK